MITFNLSHIDSPSVSLSYVTPNIRLIITKVNCKISSQGNSLSCLMETWIRLMETFPREGWKNKVAWDIMVMIKIRNERD